MTKQQSIGLRLRELFPNEDIIEDFSALYYLIDYYFPKRKLAIEANELGHKDRDQIKENKKQKDEFIRINPDEKDFSAYDELGKVQKFIDKSQEKQNKRSQKRNKRTQKEEIKEYKEEIKEDKEEIKELKEKNKELEAKIKEIEDKYKNLYN